MNKRFLTIILSLALLISTIGSTGVQVNANPLEEDAIVESSVWTIADDIWNKLYNYAISGQDETTSVDSDLITELKADVAEPTQVKFSARSTTESLEMTISTEDDSSLVIYSSTVEGAEVVLSTVISNSEVDKEIVFANDNISEEVLAAASESANDLLKSAFELWSKTLAANDIAWEDLGFVNWQTWQAEVLQTTDTVTEAAEETEEELIVEAEGEVTVEETDEKLTVGNTDENEITEDTEVSDDEITEDIEAIAEDENAEEAIVDEDGADETVENADLDEEIEETEEVEVSEEELDSAMPLPSVERIDVNYTRIELKPGESVKLVGKAYPEIASSTAVTYSLTSSYYSTYLDVQPDGTVKALKSYYGEINVSVRAGGKEVNVPVTITDYEMSHFSDENGNSVINSKSVIITDDIWVSGFCKTGLGYTGKAVTQNLEVCCGTKKLELNKDYTLTYKNNINVCDEFSANSASVTVTMKGQYSGKRTLYYEILAADISSANITNDSAALTYNGKAQKLAPVVTYQDKKLVNNKDYYIEYPADLVGNGVNRYTVSYTIHGKGNFKGSLSGIYFIVPQQYNVSKATATLKSTIQYDGTVIQREDLDLKIKLPGTTSYIDPVVDTSNYIVSLDIDYTNPKSGKVIIQGISSTRSGTLVKSFKITPAYNITKNAAVSSDFKDIRAYYKNTEYNKQINVGLVDKNTNAPLDPSFYTVTYSALDKLGTVKVTYKGIGAYTGTLTKSYKLELQDNMITNTYSSYSVEYEPGSMKAKMNIQRYIPMPIELGGYSTVETLEEGKDYSVKYTNNTAVGTASFTVIPKGAYVSCNKLEDTFEIVPMSLNKCKVSLADKAYSTKPNSYKAVPTITAPNGKKLVAGKDYSKTYEYYYDDWDVPKEPLPGMNIRVKITGMGNYSGSEVNGYYRLYDSKEKSVSKLYIAVDSKTYTGKLIELDINSDIHVYGTATDMRNKTNELIPASKYVRIISYKNNIKAGNASVVLGGAVNSTEKYGGTKTVTFKILKKNYEYTPVTGVTLDQHDVTLNSTTLIATRTLTATINPSGATNKAIKWTSSKPDIVEIADATDNYCKIRAKGNGTSVITCTTQDGGKTDKCIVISNKKPVEAFYITPGRISAKYNQTYNLTTTLEPADAYIGGIGTTVTWSSSNPSIATVDSTGKVVTKTTAGTAIITAKRGTYTATCSVKVKASSTPVNLWITDSDFGAVADDNISDTTAINKCINAIDAFPEHMRTIGIPNGTYVLDCNEYAFINLQKKKGIKFIFEPNAIIKVKDGAKANHYMMLLSDCENITFEGGTFDGNWSNLSGDLNYANDICLTDSRNITFDNVTFINSADNAVLINNFHYPTIESYGIEFIDCTFNNCRNNCIKIEEVQGLDIIDCYFQSTGNNDIVVKCNNPSSTCTKMSNITADGCSFSGNININCSTIDFKNTVKRPAKYYNSLTKSSVYPD